MVHIHSNQEEKKPRSVTPFLSLSLSYNHQTRSTMTNAPAVSPLGTPTEHDNIKGVDHLRQKFRPVLLYVVSLVEFINIGMYLIYSTCGNDEWFYIHVPSPRSTTINAFFLPFSFFFFLLQSTARQSLSPSSQSHKISNSR